MGVDRRARVVELFDVVINGRDEAAISRFTVNPRIEDTIRSLLGAFSTCGSTCAGLSRRDGESSTSST